MRDKEGRMGRKVELAGGGGRELAVVRGEGGREWATLYERQDLKNLEGERVVDILRTWDEVVPGGIFLVKVYHADRAIPAPCV